VADRKDDDYLDRLDAAFAALNATARERPVTVDAEEGQGRSRPMDADVAPMDRLPGPTAVPEVDGPAPLSDAAIDAIADRVIARIGDAPLRQAVLDVAERLVREEIERIKSAHRRR
jgi:hypothetical protein